MPEVQQGGSIVLAADHSTALADFYGRLLGVTPQAGLSERHWRLPRPPGGFLEIYAPSPARPQTRQSGRLALCLQRQAVGNEPMVLLEAWTEDATGLGATLLVPPRGRRRGC
jgi:hypothetical protein